MDYFDTGISFESALRNINNAKEETKKAYRKNASIFYAIILIVNLCLITVFLALTLPFWSYLIVLGADVLIILITELIVYGTLNSTVKNKYITQEIVQIYNQENDTYFDYEYKPKKYGNEFNKKMGLFTAWASAAVTYRISNNNDTEIILTSLTTSDGKNTTVHFNGMYFMLNLDLERTFQLRSRSKPKLKGHKFKRLENEGTRMFILEDDPNTYLDSKYLSAFGRIDAEFNNSNLYIASHDKEVHIAISPKEKFDLKGEINYEEFKKYYNFFTGLLNTIETIKNELN